jgi:hypothetical protein
VKPTGTLAAERHCRENKPKRQSFGLRWKLVLAERNEPPSAAPLFCPANTGVKLRRRNLCHLLIAPYACHSGVLAVSVGRTAALKQMSLRPV